MENDLILQLEALDDLLAKRKNIESTKLKHLQTKLVDLLQELSALDEQNHAQLGAFPLPGPGLSNWQRRHSTMHTEITDMIWKTKAQMAMQKLDLQQALAQHQAVQVACRDATEDAKIARARRADYAS